MYEICGARVNVGNADRNNRRPLLGAARATSPNNQLLLSRRDRW